MPLYIDNISSDISPRENYIVSSGYQINPTAMYSSGFMGLTLLSADLPTTNSLVNGLKGMRSIGSFCHYRLVYDLYVPNTVAIGNIDVTLADLFGTTFYFKFFESLQGYQPIAAPNGNIANDAWHYSYDFGNSLPINLFPLNPSSTTAFSISEMTPNPFMQANGDIIGKAYIAFQEYTNTAPYVDTLAPKYAGKIVRVYIYRESLILEDSRSSNFNTGVSNWQTGKFLKSNKDQPILDLPTSTQDQFTDLGIAYGYGGYLYGINYNKIEGRGISSVDWLYGRSVALNNFDARPSGPNWEYNIRQGGQKSFYFNTDRIDNPILNSSDATVIGSPELRIISSNTITNAISPFEKVRFTGTFEFPGLNTSRFSLGTLQIAGPGNPSFFDYIHVFLVRSTSIPSNLISTQKRVESWGDRDSVIVDAFCHYEGTYQVLKGTYYNSPITRIPFNQLPDWFVDSRGSGALDILYGPLVLDDLTPLGSKKVKLQFDIDPVGKISPTNPNGTLALNESYRIVIVFGVSSYDGNTADPVLGVNYSSNVPGLSYSWISEAYPLIVNNDDPEDPDDPEPPRPIIRTCLPDICSYIEDYNTQFPDNLEVTPLDRIKSYCTFFSEKFDKCRVLPGNPNGNHHFEQGIRQITVRVYWDEINGNGDTLRHVLDIRQKAPSNLGPGFPYVGDIDLNVNQTLYNSNTGEYGQIEISAEYRIRDEKSVQNLQSYVVGVDGSETAQGSLANQDWTNKTLYIEYRIDVIFYAYNQPISDTFIKRQVLRVLDFDSNKPEISRTLRLRLVDGTGPNENEIYAIVDGDGELYVRAEQIVNDDDVSLNPLDPIEQDYHIALLRNTPIGNSTTSEWDNYPPTNLTQLKQLNLTGADSKFSSGLIPKAYGAFNTDLFDPSLEYEYACIKKKPVAPLADCKQSLSSSGGPGVYYYPYAIGNVDANSRWVVLSYDMYNLVDGLRFSLNGSPKFWTKSGDPYVADTIIGSVYFDLTPYLTGIYSTTLVAIDDLEDGSNCGFDVPEFEYLFTNSLSYSDQLQQWVDDMNFSPQALSGRLKAFKHPTLLILTVVFYSDDIIPCCGGSFHWRVVQDANPDIPLTSVILCCGPNDPLLPNDFGVIPELVSGRGIFAYELPITNCFQLGEVLITSPSCWRGSPTPSTAWDFSVPCPMSVLPLNTLLTDVDARFSGVNNGLYGFLVDAPPSFDFPSSLSITTTGTGDIKVYTQENDYSTFNIPVATGTLGTPLVANRPAYSGLNCPYWLILIKSNTPWTFSAI